MATNKSKLNRSMPAAKQASLGDKLDAVITLLNGIRNDLLKHDHGATYAQQTMRINAASTTVTGTSQATAAPAVDPLN